MIGESDTKGQPGQLCHRDRVTDQTLLRNVLLGLTCILDGNVVKAALTLDRDSLTPRRLVEVLGPLGPTRRASQVNYAIATE
jgi:hypothetical protein